VRRGEVYRFRVPKGLGQEPQGERFGVIVQADELLPRSVVLVEQLGAVDVQRLGKRVGRLDTEDMWAIDEALMTVLGLD